MAAGRLAMAAAVRAVAPPILRTAAAAAGAVARRPGAVPARQPLAAIASLARAPPGTRRCYGTATEPPGTLEGTGETGAVAKSEDADEAPSRETDTDAEVAAVTAGGANAAAQDAAAASAARSEREIKDAPVIFETVWRKLQKKYGDEKLIFPAEIIWLMGAPGSGKGTNTPFIQRARGITSPPIVMSSLLQNPEMRALIDAGVMISDATVLELLLEALLERRLSYGAIVDGFPRTTVQVECVKLLYDKMFELRRKFFNTPLRDEFSRPKFRICVLFVDENESLRRQLARGQAARAHNDFVRQHDVRKTGQGQLVEERVTDSDEAVRASDSAGELLIRKRYAIFKQHYNAMFGLKDRFQFHLIDASGSIEQVRNVILHEFEYQSSLELDQDTHDMLQALPLATDVGKHARQDLVRRLDGYMFNHRDLFQKAVDFVSSTFMGPIRRHAMAGRVLIRVPLTTPLSEDEALEDPLLVDMLLDILSERGFLANVDIKTIEKPVRVDAAMRIITESKHAWYFQIAFPRQHLRGDYIS